MGRVRTSTGTTSTTVEDGCIKTTGRNTLFCTYGLPEFNPRLVSATQITHFRSICSRIMHYLEPHM
jgi:hypothetical protein